MSETAKILKAIEQLNSTNSELRAAAKATLSAECELVAEKHASLVSLLIAGDEKAVGAPFAAFLIGFFYRGEAPKPTQTLALLPIYLNALSALANRRRMLKLTSNALIALLNASEESEAIRAALVAAMDTLLRSADGFRLCALLLKRLANDLNWPFFVASTDAFTLGALFPTVARLCAESAPNSEIGEELSAAVRRISRFVLALRAERAERADLSVQIGAIAETLFAFCAQRNCDSRLEASAAALLFAFHSADAFNFASEALLRRVSLSERAIDARLRNRVFVAWERRLSANCDVAFFAAKKEELLKAIAVAARDALRSDGEWAESGAAALFKRLCDSVARFADESVEYLVTALSTSKSYFSALFADDEEHSATALLLLRESAARPTATDSLLKALERMAARALSETAETQLLCALSAARNWLDDGSRVAAETVGKALIRRAVAALASPRENARVAAADALAELFEDSGETFGRLFESHSAELLTALCNVCFARPQTQLSLPSIFVRRIKSEILCETISPLLNALFELASTHFSSDLHCFALSTKLIADFVRLPNINALKGEFGKRIGSLLSFCVRTRGAVSPNETLNALKAPICVYIEKFGAFESLENELENLLVFVAKNAALNAAFRIIVFILFFCAENPRIIALTSNFLFAESPSESSLSLICVLAQNAPIDFELAKAIARKAQSALASPQSEERRAAAVAILSLFAFAPTTIAALEPEFVLTFLARNCFESALFFRVGDRRLAVAAAANIAFCRAQLSAEPQSLLVQLLVFAHAQLAALECCADEPRAAERALPAPRAAPNEKERFVALLRSLAPAELEAALAALPLPAREFVREAAQSTLVRLADGVAMRRIRHLKVGR